MSRPARNLQRERNSDIYDFADQNKHLTQADIGKLYHLTHQRISQILIDEEKRRREETAMARRRLIDTTFFEDDQIGGLSQPERLLLLAAFSSADDEGRLRAHPGYLRSLAFTYDDEALEDVQSYRDHIAAALDVHNLYAFVVYTDEKGSEFLAFINWRITNKPSHAKASIIPPPPEFNSIERDGAGSSLESGRKESGGIPEDLSKGAGGGPEKGGKGSGGVAELTPSLRKEIEAILPDGLGEYEDLVDHDFKSFVVAADNGKVSSAASYAMNWWNNNMGSVNGRRGASSGTAIMEGLMKACREQSPALVASALLKSAKYQAGTRKSWSYVKKVITEMSANQPA